MHQSNPRISIAVLLVDKQYLVVISYFVAAHELFEIVVVVDASIDEVVQSVLLALLEIHNVLDSLINAEMFSMVAACVLFVCLVLALVGLIIINELLEGGIKRSQLIVLTLAEQIVPRPQQVVLALA